jgi:hypothetical protein
MDDDSIDMEDALQMTVTIWEMTVSTWKMTVSIWDILSLWSLGGRPGGNPGNPGKPSTRVIENKHSTDVEYTNRVRASV